MNYQGDISLNDTIDVKFTTVNTTGVPTTLAGTPAVAAYVDNGTTEITAGITLGVDFDGVAGLHNVRVVASSGNGFATASNVNLVITAGTVGGNSVVGYVIGSFSIEKRAGATQASVDAIAAAVDTEVAAILAAVDTEVAAIKAKTDQLAFTSGKVDANATTAIVAGDLVAIADAILTRDFSAISGEAAYSLLNAARMLRSKWDTTGGDLHVYKEDGTTLAWQRTLSVDSNADPITGAS